VTQSPPVNMKMISVPLSKQR